MSRNQECISFRGSGSCKIFGAPKEETEPTEFLVLSVCLVGLLLLVVVHHVFLMCAGCVSVLLHFYLHAFSWLCLLPRCYMALLGRRYINVYGHGLADPPFPTLEK